MSDKTNDEKLRILQERLAHIKDNQENLSNKEDRTEKNTETISREIKTPPKKKSATLKYFSWCIILIAVGAVSFYIYNNQESFKNLISKENNQETLRTDTLITYNLNLKGNNIAIIGTFIDEESAKEKVNDLKTRGFRSSYFLPSENSESTEEVYKVFIGPYENQQETNQWIENIDAEISIINLSDGTIIKNLKTNLRLKLKKKE